MSSFSLKHRLISDDEIRKIGQRILVQEPRFLLNDWIIQSIQARESRGILDTLERMSEILCDLLPGSYHDQLSILISSLPDALDGERSDGEFGEFIYACYSYFVVRVPKYDVDAISSIVFDALEMITQRFSAEFAYRTLLNHNKSSSIFQAHKWIEHPHGHVRRLASEGTRPGLPWGKKYSYSLGDTDDIILALWNDRCDHVARSVANHLNDIAKISPDHALKIINSISSAQQEQSKERWRYLLSHGLRSLIRSNHQGVLKLLGYDSNIDDFHVELNSENYHIGDILSFAWTIKNSSDNTQNLLIECLWNFPGKNRIRSKKLRIYRGSIEGHAHIQKNYQLPLVERSIRSLYPGKYTWTWYVNGQEMITISTNIAT